MAGGEAKLVPFDEPLKSNSNMLGVSSTESLEIQ